jgi:hypothetical protein
MSVVLNGSSQRLYAAAVPGVDCPYTISVWFKSTSASAKQETACLYNTALTRGYELFAEGAVAGDPVRGAQHLSGANFSNTTTGYNTNVWQHACFVVTSLSSRAVFLNGGSKGTNTAAVSASTNINTVGVGAISTFYYFAGKLAEVALWNKALSDAQVASLAAGAVPTDIEAANLTQYWTLLSDATDTVGGVDLTAVGTPTYDAADHPALDVVIYEDLAATGGGTSGGSAVISFIAYEDLAATGGGTSGGSAVISAAYPAIPPIALPTIKRMVAVGNNQVWFEDI